MVRVEIPLNTPLDDEDQGGDEVGIMSDSEESDVDDDVGDPDWKEVEAKGQRLIGDDEYSFKPGKMPDLPVNGVNINIPRPRGKRRGRGNKDDEDDDDDANLDDSVTKKKKKKKKREIDSNEMRKKINRVKISNQDIPTSDSAFKNHPLYVLEKHLLKFQGIYPPEVVPLGFFKDKPVYPRDCVHILRSRETWLRSARTVKLGETPYKIVKARPKRDKYTGDLIRDLPLELFGEWQTVDYDPPEAENGKVPRNCYGNVDMYQECMLPKRCSWLKLPGLPRIANKLGIDCAAAVVGFDNLCGRYGAHPVIDGFIVCEESAEILQMAWEEEQENIRKRLEDKRQKRIWDNWKRLLKAAMIREKLRVKYKHS